jgi:SAM-dependent methyltransferase
VTDQAVPDEDLYAALAPVYDAWQRLGGVTPFWALTLDYLDPALARGDGSAPVTSFIDLGCGTGELLLALAARHPGWRLTGVDGSDPMLAVARGKPGAQRVAWVQCDLRALDAGAPGGALSDFAGAGAFHDTLNHLPDAAALAQVFGAVARHVLRPGGLFIFDVTNEIGFARWWKGLSTWRGPDWEIHSHLS